jgi:preprotein translocase subunit SecF
VNIVRHRRWFFILSALMIVPSLATLVTPPALRAGIDFTGGTAITVQFEADAPAAAVRDRVEAAGHEEAIVQSLGDRSYFIRVGELEPETLDDQGNVTDPGGRADLENALGTIAPVRITSVEAVSALVGSENIRNAIIAVVVAAIVIMLYVTWAFRRVPSPLRYGTAAIVALAHDVVIVLGVFSFLGKFADLEVNAMFITGVLTVIGYSVNDTIVVFDRIRENVGRFQAATTTELANLSVRETIGRSLNTSLTLLVVILALLLFGGPTIQPLLLVLLVGVIVGTYSSIFVATLMLVAWEEGELGRGLRRINPFGGRRPRRTT